ncbi:hypothetical protein [Bradyrhizobium sp. JYMT SZCCT0428]|uniref:hypothetical protein n=1 Tax=Bradyrhizobium sp. JYMT SZCCT0428 TaxID=2807673 RepID=UPI001BAB3C9F|nr:hypothetical protein [Bradyrhizobium sp. JYMT SZCCT0428]MBR1151922.1 hypothetical protein [Bradyrhizobium sp. JYMT SZCCT0428]
MATLPVPDAGSPAKLAFHAPLFFLIQNLFALMSIAKQATAPAVHAPPENVS